MVNIRYSEDHFFIEILSEIWEERGDDPSLIVVWAVKRFLLLTKVDIYFVADYGWHFFDRKYDVQASSSQTTQKHSRCQKKCFCWIGYKFISIKNIKSNHNICQYQRKKYTKMAKRFEEHSLPSWPPGNTIQNMQTSITANSTNEYQKYKSVELGDQLLATWQYLNTKYADFHHKHLRS